MRSSASTRRRTEPPAPPDPDTAAPHRFPRRVLLAVTGLSPQVVTETVYALTQKSEPAFVPTELHLLTTAEGAERARLTLLSEEPGWFHRLRRDYNLPSIDFGEGTIHVLASADGTPISDIRTRQENERLADMLTELIRKLTRDAGCALHVSIAGGRKTMGFYAGYALSLFGRPQDRLSHVLVGAPYESNQQFFYPTPYRYVIYTHPPESRPLDAAGAEVGLAEIPFVRLRPGLDERLLAGSATFSEVVTAAQRAVEAPALEIDLDGKCVAAGGRNVDLAPTHLAFLSWLARRAVEGKPGVECPKKKDPPNLEYAREYLAEYAHLADEANRSVAVRLREGMDKLFFEEIRSKLMRRLRDDLGPEGERRYGIASSDGRPKQYRIAVLPQHIHWVDRTGAPDVRKLAKSAAGSTKGL